MSLQDLQPYPLSKTSSSSMMFSILPASHRSPVSSTAEVDEIVSPPRARMSNLRPRRVSFKPTVTVRSIPHFNRYPPAMKKKIWNSQAEIEWNARRNKIEFHAEGWDWRSVVTEDQMHVDVARGELIHPCHVTSQQGTASGGDSDKTTLFSTRKVQGELIMC